MKRFIMQMLGALVLQAIVGPPSEQLPPGARVVPCAQLPDPERAECEAQARATAPLPVRARRLPPVDEEHSPEADRQSRTGLEFSSSPTFHGTEEGSPNP